MNNPADTLAALAELRSDLVNGVRIVDPPASTIAALDAALASLKGEAVDPVDRYLSLSMRHLAADDDDGSDCESLWKEMTQDQRDEANRIVSAAINSMDTTPPAPQAVKLADLPLVDESKYADSPSVESYAPSAAPQAGLSAWVSEMKTSAATEYWVCVGWGRNFGEYMTVRMSHMRNRSELEVAEWNHLFGKGTKPCIADPKFRDPEQVSSTPSPSPQGGGEADGPLNEGDLSLALRAAQAMRECADSPANGETLTPEGFRAYSALMLRLRAHILATTSTGDDVRFAAENLPATPPAQQPGEVAKSRIVGVDYGSSDQTSYAINCPCGRLHDITAAIAALAPKEKGNG